MNGIKIEIVVVNGRLMGRTFSDRWNLEMLGFGFPTYSRNQGAIKKMRRFHTSEGFAFSLVKGETVGVTATELQAFPAPTRRLAIAA
jgi:hypothetical protein